MLVLTAAVYWRGWRWLRRRDSKRWTAGKLTAFITGLATIYLALASPIEAFASLLLQVHMLQHLLLMMAVPPLIWLGAPFLPLLRGLPKEIRRYWIAPLLRWHFLQNLAARRHASRRGIASFHRSNLAVAFARPISNRAHQRRLAQNTARIFPRGRTYFLVSRRPTISGATSLVSLVVDSISITG